MKKAIFTLFLMLGTLLPAFSQCEFAVDEIDEFDSLRVIAMEAIPIGRLIPSKFLTVDGPTIVDEAKLLFSFSESDTISAFFISLGVLEPEYTPSKSGLTVKIKLENEDIVGLYNVADSGTFDDKTNMRMYLHTCILPVNYYQDLAEFYIEKIRIEYKKKKRTIELTQRQQEQVRQAIRCVGEAVNFYPIKP